MGKNKLKSALDEVSKFIKSLELTEEISGKPEFDLFFSFKDEGTLFLSGDEAIQYRDTLKFLIDSIGDESISQRTIETLFQKTIITVLDIKEKRKDQTFEKRLETDLDALWKSLTEPPTKFNVYYPVKGLDIEGLPIKVGNVHFCIFDDAQLSNFDEFLGGFKGDEEEKKRRFSFEKTIKDSEIIGKPVGLIEIMANDKEAAKTIAVKELSLTIDTINFFSDLIPYQKGHVYLPGDNERLTINIPMISKGEKPEFSFGWDVVGPLMPFSLQKLLEADKTRRLGFTKTADLLAKKRNKLDDKILTAILWAGKATVEGKKEEAFLLYAISLESLVLLENDKAELNYRLSTRVAHLLGGDLKSRQKISEKVRYLYGVRSKIVHSGSFQVTDSDLSLIRAYSKNSILRIINKEPFSDMNNIDSLVNWFEDKNLEQS